MNTADVRNRSFRNMELTKVYSKTFITQKKKRWPQQKGNDPTKIPPIRMKKIRNLNNLNISYTQKIKIEKTGI